MSSRFKAHYRVSARGWVVEATGGNAPAFTTYGRTLDAARRNLVAELAARAGTYPGNVEVVDDVDLPARAGRLLAAARSARREALAAAATAQEATATAAQALVGDGLSLRDTAYLLGISHSRVQQLVAEPSPEEDT